jgi:hypothetical protein
MEFDEYEYSNSVPKPQNYVAVCRNLLETALKVCFWKKELFFYLRYLFFFFIFRCFPLNHQKKDRNEANSVKYLKLTKCLANIKPNTIYIGTETMDWLRREKDQLVTVRASLFVKLLIYLFVCLFVCLFVVCLFLFVCLFGCLFDLLFYALIMLFLFFFLGHLCF